MADLIELDAGRGSQPNQRRAEPHTRVRRCSDKELLRPQRINDALHSRARKLDALRDLTEAQAFWFVLKRAEDIHSAFDDLDALLAGIFGDFNSACTLSAVHVISKTTDVWR